MVEKIVKVLITGVPTTGKTVLAKAWGEAYGYPVLCLSELVEQKKLYSSIDETDMAKVVRLGDLEREANKWIAAQKKSCVIESHLGCEIRLNVDFVVVLRLNPKELEKRLEKRGYIPSKVSANRMSEILDYCTILSLKNYNKKKVYELDMTGRVRPEQSFEDLGNIIAGTSEAEKLRPRINWSEQLLADSAQKHTTVEL